MTRNVFSTYHLREDFSQNATGCKQMSEERACRQSQLFPADTITHVQDAAPP